MTLSSHASGMVGGVASGMAGGIMLKRGIKRAAGWASVVMAPFSSSSPDDSVCILMYHRIARIGFVDPRVDDWNVPPDVFERQMQTLAMCATVVSLHTLHALHMLHASHPLQPLHALQASSPPREEAPAQRGTSTRPLACVTLDDGYASAYESALPVLVRYGIPATFFVPTAYVDSHEPMPFDRWGQLNRAHVTPDSWRPIGWRELERAVRTGLVSVGSHSHDHLGGRGCAADRFVEEAARSRERLCAQLGPEHARTYAYPYGNSRLGDVPAPYEAAVRAAGYELAVTTDPGLASADSNLFRLPRLEVHQLDSPPVMRAKVHGSLAPYHLLERLRPRARDGQTRDADVADA
jgi:peptidoglycan/xylan/chitin deacetylase (PgdA/CDA1 family)